MFELLSLFLAIVTIVLLSYIYILKERLEQAEKNDKRDPETGRYTK